MPDRFIFGQMCGAIVKTGTFLDLDMTSLGQTLRELWRWWTNEIGAMLPRFLQPRTTRISGKIAYWRDDGSIWLDGEPYDGDHNWVQRAAVISIADSNILIRSIELPALSMSDLRKIVMLDLDRLMPFPPNSAYADLRMSDDHVAGGKRHVQIAAIPKELARSIYQTARSKGLLPTAVGVIEDNALKFDFFPAMQSDGSVTARGNSLTFWWTAVAILFALNLGLFIYLDQQRVSRLSDLVESQSLSAVGARKVAGRIAKEDQLRGQILAQRGRNDALAQLALTTKQMPEGVWIQRYSASADMLRLAGYKQNGTDVLGTLRKSGRFSTIRASTAEGSAETGTGQPFDITAEIKPR